MILQLMKVWQFNDTSNNESMANAHKNWPSIHNWNLNFPSKLNSNNDEKTRKCWKALMSVSRAARNQSQIRSNVIHLTPWRNISNNYSFKTNIKKRRNPFKISNKVNTFFVSNIFYINSLFLNTKVFIGNGEQISRWDPTEKSI